MTTIAWILIIAGALINFGAKPLLAKKNAEGDSAEKLLYLIKTVALCIVILGAAMIFIAGGRVNV